MTAQTVVTYYLVLEQNTASQAAADKNKARLMDF